MNPEDPFRLALVAILVATLPIGIFFRIQAATTGETVSRTEEGKLFAAGLRLSGLGLWLATLAYLVEPELLPWAHVPLPAWLRWVGVACGALSPVWMYWTLSSLGKNLTDTVMVRQAATLVTRGPYRWVRHPFYVTAAWMMASVTLLSASWLIGLGCLVVLALLVRRTPLEEQKLIERFGDEYRKYMAVTGRYWPRLWR